MDMKTKVSSCFESETISVYIILCPNPNTSDRAQERLDIPSRPSETSKLPGVCVRTPLSLGAVAGLLLVKSFGRNLTLRTHELEMQVDRSDVSRVSKPKTSKHDIST